MADSVTQTSEFEIKSLVILSPKDNVEIDIRAIFQELNIYDSVLLNTVSGDIIIVDSLGVLRGFEFDGTQYLYIELSKNKDLFVYKNAFHIYKQSLKDVVKPGAISYKLNFISDEYTVSEQTKVAQHYELPYSEIAKRILNSYLKIDKVPVKFGK